MEQVPTYTTLVTDYPVPDAADEFDNTSQTGLVFTAEDTTEFEPVSPKKYMLVERQRQLANASPSEDTTADSCCRSLCFATPMFGPALQPRSGARGMNPIRELAFSVGWRGIIYTMFSSQYCVYNVVKFVQLVLSYVLVLLLLTANGAIIGLQNKSLNNKSTITLTTVNILLSVFLVIYMTIDVVINLRFFCKKYCIKRGEYNSVGVVPNMFCGSFRWFPNHILFFADMVRQILPEMLLYPLFLISFCFALLTHRLVFFHDVKGDQETVFTNISVFISALLLCIMVYVNRIIFVFHSLYSIHKIQYHRLSKTRCRSFTLQILLFTYSLSQTMVQMLILGNIIKTLWGLVMASDEGKYISVDWKLWFFMSYGFVVHILGMFMFTILNYPLLQAFCVEFFHSTCKEEESQLSSTDSVRHGIDDVENQTVQLDLGADYPSLKDTCYYPFKNIFVCGVCLIYSGIVLTVIILHYMETAFFEGFIALIMLIVNIEPLLVFGAVAVVIAAILIAFSFHGALIRIIIAIKKY